MCKNGTLGKAAAKVPILPGYFDNGRKRVGFGPEFWPTGDAEADIGKLRQYYAQFERRA